MPRHLTFEMHSDFLHSLEVASKGRKDVQSAIWKRIAQIQKHMLKHGKVPPDTTHLSDDVCVHTFGISSPHNKYNLLKFLNRLFPSSSNELIIYYVSFQYDHANSKVRFAGVGQYCSLLHDRF